MKADVKTKLQIPPMEPSRCTGCGRCVAVCRDRLLTLETSGRRKYAALTAPMRCSQCGRCIKACPFAEGTGQGNGNADRI